MYILVAISWYICLMSRQTGYIYLSRLASRQINIASLSRHETNISWYCNQNVQYRLYCICFWLHFRFATSSSSIVTWRSKITSLQFPWVQFSSVISLCVTIQRIPSKNSNLHFADRQVTSLEQSKYVLVPFHFLEMYIEFF